MSEIKFTIYDLKRDYDESFTCPSDGYLKVVGANMPFKLNDSYGNEVSFNLYGKEENKMLFIKKGITLKANFKSMSLFNEVEIQFIALEEEEFFEGNKYKVDKCIPYNNFSDDKIYDEVYDPNNF